ncbi:cell division cycle 20-like protein 1, cofactor of APC complex [Entomortierella parvispora]|uniref:Cell division cycle 20-like protein 1, cofactor of APC complex n=1 Tax=Entomortierella parvispora TaxID=205924 RepID=A0A9P3LRZ9_9FUNG|nr:cell division cycle 20-like protein 1, cofactor of APC complex [Entomortierella parvispora]
MKGRNKRFVKDSSSTPEASAPLVTSVASTSITDTPGTEGGPVRRTMTTRSRKRAAPGAPPPSHSPAEGERVGVFNHTSKLPKRKDIQPEHHDNPSVNTELNQTDEDTPSVVSAGALTMNGSSRGGSSSSNNDQTSRKAFSSQPDTDEPSLRATTTAIESRAPFRSRPDDFLRSPPGLRSPPPQGLRSPSGLRSPPGLKSPIRKFFYDRYIPAREGELAEKYNRLPGTPTTPLMQEGMRRSSISTTPGQAESGHQTIDHHKRAMHEAHDSLIASQMQMTGTRHGPVSSIPRRLFEFSSTTTQNVQHHDSPNRQVYQEATVTQEARKVLLNPTKSIRQINKVPFKILDAPELRDDFYLNLVDWSSQNVLGVGLGSCVYLWSAMTSSVNLLCDLGANDSVTSISWVSSGAHLAIGTEGGAVQLWDVQASQRIRTMTGHTGRVGALAWNDHTLTSGSRDRNIYHRDVRAPGMWQHKLVGHDREVCGLKWSNNGSQLASGGNDNRLMVWGQGSTTPTFTFHDHTAAVKAIDWSPHEANLLASGGGTADRHIRFWNTSTGKAISATDTGSQVCNLAWSKTSRELVSTHGFQQNQVLVWKYPQMQQLASLPGHQMRVLYLALSPDGQTIVTGAGDETLRFWNVFQKSKSDKSEDDDTSFSLPIPQTTLR